MVPMLAASLPSAAQIWRVNAATEVLPLVPVTAAIVFGWRAIEARRGQRQRAPRVGDRHEHRAGRQRRRRFLADDGRGARRSGLRREAPSRRPCCPATATNTSPGFTARLSAVTPRHVDRAGARVERGQYR